MLTDYKISRTKTLPDGTLEVVYRVYEGDVTTGDEPGELGGKMVPITRYRRTKMIKEYTVIVKDSPEIHVKAKEELAKDSTRSPIDEQKIKSDAK